MANEVNHLRQAHACAEKVGGVVEDEVGLVFGDALGEERFVKRWFPDIWQCRVDNDSCWRIGFVAQITTTLSADEGMWMNLEEVLLD